MYGIPKTGQIAQDALVKHLEPYVYHYSRKTPGPWTHNSRQINFTLVVNEFGVKYSGKDHALHLKSALEDKYKVNIDWEGKLFIGIAMKWDYEKITVQLSMPSYLRAVLHSFQHENKTFSKTHHTPGHNSDMEKQSDAIRKSYI